MKNSKKGFTLVELSIVLVIIGLLIGGILVAQSMINTTKIQAFVRQIGQFDAAVMNFKDKFQSLPGDSDVFAAAVGDSDGYILVEANGTAGTTTTWAAADEVANFWLQLSQTGLKPEGTTATTYSDTYAASFPVNGATPISPKSKVGTNAGFIAIGYAGTDGTLDAAGNAYAVVNCTASTGTAALSCSSFASGPDGIAIDTKLDDGVGTSGNVVGFDHAAETDLSDLIDNTTAEEAYVATESTDDSTALIIRMGASAGSPQ